MAQILLLADGSSGDINPFIAVGYELRARGHVVRFALTERWAGFVTRLGFPVDPIPADAPVGSSALPTGQNGALAPIAPLRRVFEQGVLPTLPAKIAALQVACRNTDLLVSGALQIPASIVAERTGIPWASLVIPALCIPSAEFAPMPSPSLPHPWRDIVNVPAWAVGAWMLRQIAERQVQALRQAYGLAPRRNVLLTGSLSPKCVVVAISPTFLPPPSDWPPYVHMTSFCYWDAAPEWQPSAALQKFLEAPEPIVAVSSGSWAPTVADAYTAFYRTSIAAIRQVGARALIVGAAPNVFSDPLPPDVYAVPEAPFSYVYPRCTAVIHHGGLGTVAQALRAAVPMLVSPLGFDQFFNAARVAQIKAGVWTTRPRYSVNRVAAQLMTLFNSRTRAHMQTLAHNLAAEDGVAATCNVLEKFALS